MNGTFPDTDQIVVAAMLGLGLAGLLVVLGHRDHPVSVTATPKAAPVIQVQGATNLMLRSGPPQVVGGRLQKAPAIGSLLPGTRLQTLEERQVAGEAWCEVAVCSGPTLGSRGWVDARYLAVVKD